MSIERGSESQTGNSENYIEELTRIRDTIPVETDDAMEKSDKSYIRVHNNNYTKLLDSYVTNASKSLEQKRTFKKIFFWGCVITMVLTLLILAASLIIAAFMDNTIQIMTSIIASTVSFASVFIVLPRVIVVYLFNTADEKNMTDIIKNMQDYDKFVRENIGNADR